MLCFIFAMPGVEKKEILLPLFIWNEMTTDTENKKPLLAISCGVDGIQIILRTVPCAHSFIVYELIRAFFFLLFVKHGFRSISLTMRGRLLFANCLCSAPLYIWQFVIVSLMPALLLGILPLCYTLFSGRFIFLLISIPFLLMGINDYNIIWLLRYFEGNNLIINYFERKDEKETLNRER